MPQACQQVSRDVSPMYGAPCRAGRSLRVARDTRYLAIMRPELAPCLDDRCPIHARGADRERASRRTCARQILRAYDRDGAIELLEQEAPLPEIGSQRVIVPIACSPIGAGQSARISVSSIEGTSPRRVHRFRAERIVLHQGDASWRIDDILMDGKSQIAPHRGLPAELFFSRVSSAGICVFDRIAQPLSIEILVTRLGGSVRDVLTGGIIGQATYEPRVLSVRSEVRASRGAPAVQFEVVCEQSIEVHQFVLTDGEDWIVHDIAIDGRSGFAQGGDIPGEAFSPETLDNFSYVGTFRAGSRVRIHATYTGHDPEGCRIEGEFKGQEPA